MRNIFSTTTKWITFTGICLSLIAATALLFTYIYSQTIEAQRLEDLNALKIVANSDQSETVVQLVRDLDTKVRKDIFRRHHIYTAATSLLVIGMLTLFTGLKTSGALKKISPVITKDSTGAAAKSKLARNAIAFVMICLLLAAFSLGLYQNINSSSKPDDTKAIAPYPTAEEIASNWPRFRGLHGAGICTFTDIPQEWDAATDQNILWKSPIPMDGFNSPIVWDDKVFIAGANEESQQVYCYDAESGKLLWTSDVTRTPGHIEIMEDTGYAAPTMATDGRRVYAIFASGDIGCFDYSGNKLWEVKLGIPDSAYGYATSLDIYQDLLIVQFDQGYDDDLSKIIAINTATGTTTWQTKRPLPGSWTSPIIINADNKDMIITAGEPLVIAYDPKTGAEIWQVDCLGTDVAPSPIYAGDLILVIEPYTEIVAINPAGTGDVTETNIVWTAEDAVPDICSPASDGQKVYTLTTQGTLTCYNLTDGKLIYQHDMDDNFQASPSIIGNELYLLSEDGTTTIIEIADQYKEITQNKINEKTLASMAFAQGKIFIRGEKNLYCIGTK